MNSDINESIQNEIIHLLKHNGTFFLIGTVIIQTNGLAMDAPTSTSAETCIQNMEQKYTQYQ